MGIRVKSNNTAQVKAEWPIHIILDDGSHVLSKTIHTSGRSKRTDIYGYKLINHGINTSTDKYDIANIQWMKLC